MAMAGMSQQGPSLLGAVQNWYNGLPLCTRATFSVITGIFVVQLITGWYGSQATAVSLVPHAVLYDYQVYRFFTAVLIHGGLLHVTFNMLAFVPIGSSLERSVGTWQLLHFVLLSCLLEGVIYVVVSGLLAASGLIRGALFHGAMGFSGVIFGLLVWDSALLSGPSSSHRTIFGLIHVPTPWYPWVLLLLCQLMLPEASFLGHLAGLLVGQLWVWGYLRPLALPRSATLWLEHSSPLARCVQLPSFVTMPSSGLPYSMYDAGAGRGGGGGSSSGGGGVRLGALSRNIVSLGKLLRNSAGGGGGGGGGAGGDNGRSGDGGGDVEAAGANTSNGPTGGREVFVGTGRVLGGGGGGGMEAGAAAQPPNVAAALAAEARMGSVGGGGAAAAASGTTGSGTAGGSARAAAARDKPLKP